MPFAALLPVIMVATFAQRVILDRQEWERTRTFVKVDNRVNELVKSPAFREEMRQKAQQKLEDERDQAFYYMDRDAYHRSIAMWRSGGGSKFLCEWREQAMAEWQQLRETEERLRSREKKQRAAEDKEEEEEEEPFVAARIQLTCEITSAGETRISHKSGELVEGGPGGLDYAYSEMPKILPITPPHEFARGFKLPPPVVPGKRYSCGEMPRMRCKAEHYHWLKDCVRPGPVESSRHE